MRDKFFIETRGCSALMLVMGVLGALLAWLVGAIDPVSRTCGFLFPSPSSWIVSSGWNLAAAIFAEVVAFAGMFALTRAYNLVRDANYLPAGLFMVLQGATAVSTGAFNGGSLMLLCAVFATILFFSLYQNPTETRRILAVFVLLGTGSLVQFGFLPFVIVYFIACIQMRVMSFRAFIAILAGLLVPAWILLGSGIVGLDDLNWPEVENPFTEGFASNDIAMLVTVGLTLIVGLVCGSMNMMTLYSRNARTRAYNGLIAATGIMAGVMCVADMPNLAFYIPVLNLATAYQLALFYAVRRNKATNIVVKSLCGVYACLFIWSLLP